MIVKIIIKHQGLKLLVNSILIIRWGEKVNREINIQSIPLSKSDNKQLICLPKMVLTY